MSFLTSLRPSLARTGPSTLAAGARLFSTSPRSALSKFTVIGRLASSPELITTGSGRELVRYAVGTSTGYGEQKVTSWWKVAAFLPEGPVRDNLMGLGKGSMIFVEGDASMRKFERDGRTETGLSLVQTRYDVLDRRSAPPVEGEVTDEQ